MQVKDLHLRTCQSPHPTRFYKILLFIYLCLFIYLLGFWGAVLGLLCCVWAFFSCCNWGLPSRWGALLIERLLVAEHRLWSGQTAVAAAHGRGCPAVCIIFPDQGPVSPALTGRLLATGSLGKSKHVGVFKSILKVIFSSCKVEIAKQALKRCSEDYK